MTQKGNLGFSIEHKTPFLAKATVTVPAPYIDTLFHEAAQSQIHRTDVYGFAKGQAPLAYIKEHFKPRLTEHLQELLFKYCVLSVFYKKINDAKLVIIGEPRISTISIAPGQDAQFNFDVSTMEPIEFYEWRLLPFKPPKRKNYKDIDRQVTTFIKEESEVKIQENLEVSPGDWVLFDIRIIDQNHKPFLGDYYETLCLKMGDEEVDLPLKELFLQKKIGDEFYTDAAVFQEYFSNLLETNYHFHIIIKDIIPIQKFCFEEFKRHFRLKNNKEVQQKFIEIFSFKNDLTQRRLMVEEVFRVLFQKHHFEIPNQFIVRQEEHVFNNVHESPDYQVYKNERSFREYVRRLAAKQVKEGIMIDQLKCKEGINATDHDIKSYLNLTKRPRTKEFIHFEIPSTKVQGQEVPVPCEILRQYAHREKTLNYVIYHLTKDD